MTLTTEQQLALLAGQVQQLSAQMQQLLERTPDTSRLWLTSSELAKAAGCSPRFIQKYAGKLPPGAVRSVTRGSRVESRFHRTLAIEALDQLR